ncbi:MAG: substrate-binding domain-containing protein [Lachnospiraceae bacterium]
MKVSRKWLFVMAAIVSLGIMGCAGNGKVQGRQPVEGLDKLGEILVISREEGSGTRSAFAQLADFQSNGKNQEQTDLTRADAQIANNADEVIAEVEKNVAAIGYVSMGALDGTKQVKVLSINGVEADIRDEKYPLDRAFYLAYCGKLTELEQDFLTYVHGAGQEIVGQSYVPIAKSNTFLSNKADGTILIAGSTSIAPLMEELAAAYMKLNPNAEIVVEQSDSSDGLTRAMSGTCDFGMSSRELKDYEKELLEYEMIAKDDIAVIVNGENPLEDITTAELKDIFTGATIRWDDLND